MYQRKCPELERSGWWVLVRAKHQHDTGLLVIHFGLFNVYQLPFEMWVASTRVFRKLPRDVGSQPYEYGAYSPLTLKMAGVSKLFHAYRESDKG